MLQTHFNPIQPFPVEDRFIKDWFHAVFQSFELTGSSGAHQLPELRDQL